MNAFRRPGKRIHDERRHWAAWLDAHAELVTAAGLPAAAIGTEDAWWYFIDRTYTRAGFLGTDTWFGVDQMTPDQRRACVALIERWIAERNPDLNEYAARQLRATFGPTAETRVDTTRRLTEESP